MVQNKPYVHFKIINERVPTTVDTNYLWATTVECEKGPIEVPILIQNANEAMDVFGVDMRGYFAQGAENLLMVRVAATSKTRVPTIASTTINAGADFEYKYVKAVTFTKTVTTGTGAEAITTTEDTGIQKFIFTGTPQALNEDKTLKFNGDEPVLGPEVTFDVIPKSTSSLKYVKATSEGEVDVTDYYVNAKGTQVQRTYDSTMGTIVAAKEIATEVIEEGSPLIKIEAKYPGTYDINLVLYQNILYKGYNLTLEEKGNGYITINNVTDLLNIINRINDKNLNVIATLTNDGKKVVNVTRTSISAVKPDLSDAAIGQILPKDSNDLTKKYTVELAEIDDYYLTGGSNGEWNAETGRIPSQYQASAHKRGLELLRAYRLCGIFCMYGEDLIQREYVLHGYDPSEPDKGMNNDETCKWRMILLGANEEDRDSAMALESRALALNNQYILLLGQGLIENGVQLMPYECTQYIAGLRAALFYGDSIFGGQKRKEIKGVYDNLKIAPLLSYETSVVWQPDVYIALNEAGVLTFTEDYGRLTLTDGVTTRQDPAEEDEEAVMSILKYAQNAVYDVCVSYIGRNITADTQASLEMEISSVLNAMLNEDQTLITLSDEGINAYEVDVVMNPRSIQLLGKVQVYLKITPVHALRQIEVEMTVQ